MWNIWGFSWEWQRRRPLVAAELADLEPDVVFLHEARAARCPWEAGQSTPQQVAGDTGIPLIEWIDAPTAHPTARMGPALLSRVSPVRTSRLRLADRDSLSDLGYHEPWLLTAELEVDGFRATVATTHLPMSSLSAAQDVAVHSLAEALPPLAGESELLLLIGDLNMQSHSSRLFRLMQAAGLESVPSLSTAPPTWPTSSVMFNQEALASGHPWRVHHPEAQPIRLDYTLVHRRDAAPLRIADAGRFGTRHRTDDLFASDHWGLWVDLAIA